MHQTRTQPESGRQCSYEGRFDISHIPACLALVLQYDLLDRLLECFGNREYAPG